MITPLQTCRILRFKTFYLTALKIKRLLEKFEQRERAVGLVLKLWRYFPLCFPVYEHSV